MRCSLHIHIGKSFCHELTLNFQIKYTLNKKKVTREKEGHSIVIKGSIQQENILTIKIFTCTNRCKLHEAKADRIDGRNRQFFNSS